jgi:hypothetical protein
MNVDRKQLIMLIVVGTGLVGALGYMFMNMYGGSGSQPGVNKPGQNGNMPQRLETVDIDIDVPKLLNDVEVVSFSYQQSKIERDPMKPLVGTSRIDPLEGEAEGEGSGMDWVSVRSKRITGIMWDEEDPLAVVDDLVVHEGYVYPHKEGTARIVVDTILPGGVIFLVNDTPITVEMKE